MSILKLKEKPTRLINNIDDEVLLNAIYQMVSGDKAIYKLTEAQKAQITRSKGEIKEGLFSAHDDVRKRTSEWLQV